jgi:hypothetical protein
MNARGSEMRTALRSEERRAISLAAAMIAPDKSAFRSRYPATPWPRAV